MPVNWRLQACCLSGPPAKANYLKGIAGFIVGFALQDTLGKFASGIMILHYRPCR